MSKIIPMQALLDKPLDIVSGNPDYEKLIFDLDLIDLFLSHAKLEERAMEYFIARAEKWHGKALKNKQIEKAQREGVWSLRCSILRKFLNLPLRTFALQLAGCPLFQRFCRINRWLCTNTFSHQKINELENALSPEIVKEYNLMLNSNVILNAETTKKLKFEKSFDLENLYGDTTCMKVNIHYPVDWLLIRDMIRTSMVLVHQIRKSGIKIRMPYSPSECTSGINKLCIEMHNSYRCKDANKKRKAIFRKMKKYLKQVLGHVESHMIALKESPAQSNLSHLAATRIVNRLEEILKMQEEVVRIAHTRIIKEQIVVSEDKILSIYESDVHVITRNKAGIKVEFGNTMYLIEQQDGFIVDYLLLKDVSPGDPKLGIESLDRILKDYSNKKIKSMVFDRGFDSKDFKKKVEELNEKNQSKIEYNVLPRNPIELKERMKDENFKMYHKRRSSTEAKIAHVKRIADNPMKQKGIRNRQVHLGLSVMVANLKRLLMIMQEQKEKDRKTQAA